MDAATASKKFQESKVLFASGNFQQSLGMLDEVDRAFPHQKNIVYAKAMCLKNLGRREEAIAACQSVLSRFDDTKTKALLKELEREDLSAGLNLSDLLPTELRGAAPAPPAAVPPPLPSLPSGNFFLDEPIASTQAPPPPLEYAAPRGTRRYVIPGVVVAAVLLLLIGFPLVRGLMKGGGDQDGERAASSWEAQPRPAEGAAPGETAPGSVEGPVTGVVPAQTTAPQEVPAQITWYRTFSEGMQVAQQYQRYAFVFVTDESEASQKVEQTILMDQEVRRQSLNFICIRDKYDPNADPETQQPFFEEMPRPPVVRIYDSEGFPMMEMAGEELTTESLAAGMSVFATIKGLENFDYELPIGGLLLAVAISFFLAPWPLFLTLFFSGKLPMDGFVNNFISVGFTALRLNLLIGSLFGTVKALVILKDDLDMGIVDLVIFGVLYVFYLLTVAVLIMVVLGHAFLQQLLAS